MEITAISTASAIITSPSQSLSYSLRPMTGLGTTELRSTDGHYDF